MKLSRQILAASAPAAVAAASALTPEAMIAANRYGTAQPNPSGVRVIRWNQYPD